MECDTAEIRSRFGQTVRRARLNAGLSQEALADLAKIDRTYVSSVERGRRNIGIDNISKLAWALGLQPVDLFNDSAP